MHAIPQDDNRVARHRTGARLAGGCIALSGLSIIPTCLGPAGWAFALGCTFTVHFIALCLLCAGLCMYVRRPRTALLCVAAAAVHLGIVAIGVLPKPPPPGPHALRLLVANVHTSNRDVAATGRLIRRFDPDLVALLEVDSHWINGLRPLVRGYPTRLEFPRSDNFGIAAYARADLAQLTSPPLGDVRTIRADLAAPHSASVYLAHVLPPISTHHAHNRNRHLQAIAHDIAQRGRPAAVLGDLNTTPYEPAFRRLRQDAHLQRAGSMAGSWPTGLPALLRIPIDHTLVSAELAAEATYGPDIGSDHLPLLVHLGRRP